MAIIDNTNQTTPTPATSSIGEEKSMIQTKDNLNTQRLNAPRDQATLASIEAMRQLAPTVFNPASMAGTHMAQPPMQPMSPMGQMHGNPYLNQAPMVPMFPQGNPYLNQHVPGIPQHAGMFQQPGMPPQGSPWFPQQLGSANWMPPNNWPVNPLETGKIVFFVDGLGLTFFEGKDIPGVCKVLSQNTPDRGFVGVTWALCTTSSLVRVLQFPPMSSATHPGSWTELLTQFKRMNQMFPVSFNMEQLKTFIWAERPGLAKMLKDDVPAARSDATDNSAEAYFEAQRALAEENRKA